MAARARQELTLWRTWVRPIGVWDVRAAGLGGWTLSVHHTYDPTDQTLYRGDGERQSTKAFGPTITTAAGALYGATGVTGAVRPLSERRSTALGSSPRPARSRVRPSQSRTGA